MLLQSSTRNVVWLAIAMTIAIIIYSVARRQLWANEIAC
jgi:hypothetical protein